MGALPSGASGALFSLAHPAPTSPVPAIPRSRSGTPRRSSWRPRKISCSFSKCSEEAAEVAMAQAALEQRAPRLWAQGPLLFRRQPPSPAGITATAATVAQDEALPGPRRGPPRVFSNESVLCITWPKYWSFSFSISPSSEYSGLIFFRILIGLISSQSKGLSSLLQHHGSKASILQCSAFFMVQLSHPYMTT